jgi:hypothetical protein
MDKRKALAVVMSVSIFTGLQAMTDKIDNTNSSGLSSFASENAVILENKLDFANMSIDQSFCLKSFEKFNQFALMDNEVTPQQLNKECGISFLKDKIKDKNPKKNSSIKIT